jgi:hypothetical protein
MAGYSVIADTGNAIVRLLREHMVPDVIMNADTIGVYTPDDKGDITLGVYLYDIRESKDIRQSSMIEDGISRQKYPSTFMELYYMVTAYSNGDVKFRSLEEQKMLGRAAQVLMDYAQLLTEDGERLARIELLQLENDEKMRLWNVPNVPYKLSLFYKAGPVELESEKTKKVTRVTSIDMTFQEKEAEGSVG